jgi:hypothetical protein
VNPDLAGAVEDLELAGRVAAKTAPPPAAAASPTAPTPAAPRSRDRRDTEEAGWPTPASMSLPG